MSIWQAFVSWIWDQQEAVLRRSFVGRADSESLKKLLTFTVDHGRPFPMKDVPVREAVFSTKSWRVEAPYQEPLFTSVESYLFGHVQTSDPGAWRAWMREARRLEHEIDAEHPDTAQALGDAYQAGKLAQLPEQDLDYLVLALRKPFSRIHRRLGEVDAQESLPILLEYATSAQHLSAEALHGWIIDKRALILRERFVNTANERTLTDLLVFVVANDRPFPIENPPARDALFGLGDWHLGENHQEPLFLCVEGYLFSNVITSQPREWSVWLDASRRAGRRIDVLNPITANALFNAHNAGKLADLSQEAYDYLLGCYLRNYGEVLERLQPSDQLVLPVLLEFAAIAQLIGPDESYLKVLRRWAEQKPTRPRSLTNLTDEQACNAPRRGVGSPHGLSLTLYHDPASNVLVRIVCAGTTGDATLNSQIFTNLFAAALACDSEPTFLMSGGCALSLSPGQPSTGEPLPQKLGSFVIGPAGPMEPSSHTPTVGMDVQEALLLIADTFQRAQEDTGLVQVKRWQMADAEELDRRIRQALTSRERSPHVIKSSNRWSEGAGVVHAMPLLHRDESGVVVPIEIGFPYHLLGAERVFRLLRNGRQGYMEQLITAGQRRRAFAEQIYEIQDRLVKRWQSQSPEAKQAAIQEAPTVFINREVNFELGIEIQLASPKPVPRQNYEEFYRPLLRDNAREYARRYEALVRKLQSLNTPGGSADFLTFKLLVDAMIRQAGLPIAHAEFQSEYREWVEVSAIPVWAAIQDWAVKRGMSPKALAADNILFSARLETSPQRVVVQPWVLVDLHDFVIRIDCDKGLMEVLPGSQMTTLTDSLVPVPEHSIHDLESLHATFCAWAKDVPGLRTSREAQIEALRSGILDDQRIYPLVQLDKAKQYLFNGQAGRASRILDGLRQYDIAAVYFWGAVASEYLLMQSHQHQFVDAFTNLTKDELAQRTLNASMSALIDYARVIAAGQSSTAPYWDLQTGTLRPRNLPTNQAAESFMAQLRSKDPAFVNGLLEERPDIFKLERRSLGLKPNEEKQVQAATSALASIEFLSLAEAMKFTARNLPFAGELSSELRRDLDGLIERGRSLMFRETLIAAQIEELAQLYGGDRRQAATFRKQLSPTTDDAPKPPSTEKITGVDVSIYERLRNTLSDCDDFASNERLKTVFSEARITVWIKQVPEQISTASRINALINFMVNQYHPDTRENGLVLFLQVLGSRLDPRDARRQDLSSLAREFEHVLPGPGARNDDLAYALPTSRQIVVVATQERIQASNVETVMDAWSMAAIKRHLHVLSEFVAQAAAQEAVWASTSYSNDILTTLVPLIVDLRWNRGYASGLNKLLDIPPVQKCLNAFRLEAPDPPCPVMDGVLSAEKQGADWVAVRLGNHPAALVRDLTPADVQLVLNTVNGYGRLGAPGTAGMSLLDRIGAIPVMAGGDTRDAVAKALFRNRETLIPLIARWGMPGSEWLLPDEELLPQFGKPLLGDLMPSIEDPDWLTRAQELLSQVGDLVEPEFLAQRAFEPK